MARKCTRKKTFAPEEIRKAWAEDKKVMYRCKKYFVGKMSYGDYFLEPVSEGRRGETEGFSPNVLWLEKKKKRNRYGVLQVYYKVE